MTDKAGHRSPHLSEQEQAQAATTAPVGSVVIHEVVREQGEAELARPSHALALSGLAAGLSIGFSFVLQAYLRAGLPEAPWARLVDVVLGQQQLFTETTLTALIPALTERSLGALLGTLRVWGVVLAANLGGTLVFGAISAQPGVFSPEAYAAMGKLSAQTMAHPFWETMITAGSAGWLIGLMVWLLPGSGPARPLIVVALTYAVAVCQFPHVIAGSVEASFGVFAGAAGVTDYLVRFLVPTLLGNTIGGTLLAGLLNHAPVSSELTGKPED